MLNKLKAIWYILRGHGVIYRTHLAPYGKHGVQAHTLGGPLCVKESSLGMTRCYRCGEYIKGFFHFEVLKKRTSTSPPREAVVCGECRAFHPECEYARGE